MAFLKDSYLPTLDLHGYDREYAKFKTKEFIKDYHNSKWYFVQIIHGKGSGAVKEEVHKILKRSKFVDNYRIDRFNDGCTIITLEGGGELDKIPQLW